MPEGEVLVRDHLEKTFLRIDRKSIRQVEYDSERVRIWFVGEGTPYQVGLGEGYVRTFLSDLLESGMTVTWEYKCSDADSDGWYRHGVLVRAEDVADDDEESEDDEDPT